MLFYAGLIFLIIAVSLDSFGVGMTYGMRHIHVPFIAFLIIMLCSGTIVFLSMTIGHTLSSFISPQIASILGSSILILLGLISFFNLYRSPAKQTEPVKSQHSTKHFNTLTSILTTPDKADLDRSGMISVNEAFLLGAALALDAFGAGIGASLLGYSPLMTTVLVAMMSGLFLLIGIRTGLLLAKCSIMRHVTFIPPVLLITLGVINLL